MMGSVSRFPSITFQHYLLLEKVARRVQDDAQGDWETGRSAKRGDFATLSNIYFTEVDGMLEKRSPPRVTENAPMSNMSNMQDLGTIW